MERQAVAMIADIVGSRGLDDRAAAQEQVLGAFRAAEARSTPSVAAYATVGDEFQTVYRTIEQAIVCTTIVLLALPDDVELRFGIGVGSDEVVGGGDGAGIRDGDAWWRAREAIDGVRRTERSGRSRARTGFAHDGGIHERSVRGLLLLRDQIVGDMRPRDRRIALAGLDDVPQARTAVAEGIVQSAVSQSWHRSGAVSIVEMVRGFESDAS